MTSILETGKDGYDANAEFDARTKAATDRLPSEWGDPDKLFERDALEVLSFVQGDFQHVAPILAKLRGYRLLDIGCGYGRLTPLLTAFHCNRYIGIDPQDDRIAYAMSRWGQCSARFARFFFVSTDPVHDENGKPKSDVVWTSTVLQHLVLPEKKRLVERMKAARAEGGICLLREEEIQPMSLAWCEERYASRLHPKHMIPVPEDLMREWFRPLEFRRVGGNVWIAREPGSKIGG